MQKRYLKKSYDFFGHLFYFNQDKIKLVNKMNIKKNCGIVLIILGIILTLDRTNEFKGIVSIIVYYIQEYWPLLITFCGVSLLATPQKTKKK